jgi:hypothetical protein
MVKTLNNSTTFTNNVKGLFTSKKHLNGSLPWKAIFFIPFSLEKHHLDTKQDKKNTFKL